MPADEVTQLKKISAIFDSCSEARRAVSALEQVGVDRHEINLISWEGEVKNFGSVRAAGVGAFWGSVGGLLGGLGIFADVGVVPIVGAGVLATMLVGAVAGGVAGGRIGSLSQANPSSEGVTLVTASVDDDHLDAAQIILKQHRHPDTAGSTNTQKQQLKRA